MAPDDARPIKPWPASKQRAPKFDEGRHHRASIGFVLLAMEQTVESDMMRHAPDGVGVHFARAPMANRVSVETLAAMESGIGYAAGRILPDKALDVACYACTSGSVVIGEDNVFAQLNRGAPGAKPTSLITGVMRALEALGARRIVVATPGAEVDQPEADAIFISCGALRSVEIIDALEERTGKPVVTSNQAMLWDCLRLAGVNDRMDGLGRLFREF